MDVYAQKNQQQDNTATQNKNLNQERRKLDQNTDFSCMAVTRKIMGVMSPWFMWKEGMPQATKQCNCW